MLYSGDSYEVDQIFSEQSGYKGIHDLKLKRVEAGLPVYDLSMLNPDIPPARSVIDRLVQASLKGFNHRYGVSRGIKRLREGFAEKYKAGFSASIDPASEVCVTLGCKDATLHLFRIFAASGKDIAVFDPCYPPYLSAAQYHSLRVHRVQWTNSESDSLVRIESLVTTKPIAAVVVNFPMNPTGDTVTVGFWSKLVELAKKYSFVIVNDFAYGELVHSGTGVSLMSIPDAKDVGVEIYTMSKAYNIPGWRVAAVVGNSGLVEKISKIKSKIDYGMFLPVQIAAAGTLLEGLDIAKGTREVYFRRLRALCSGLNNLGWECAMPKAGGSLWIKLPNKLKEKYGAADLASVILDKTGVAVLSGELFGVDYVDYVRMAAVLSEDKIREALTELERI
jgi:alanine-synthesizing transaminase